MVIFNTEDRSKNKLVGISLMVATLVLLSWPAWMMIHNMAKQGNRPTDSKIKSHFHRHEKSLLQLTRLVQQDKIEFVLDNSEFVPLPKERKALYKKLLTECGVQSVRPTKGKGVNFSLHSFGFLDTGTYTDLLYSPDGPPMNTESPHPSRKSGYSATCSKVAKNWFITYRTFD